jgi:hypothetical protein
MNYSHEDWVLTLENSYRDYHVKGFDYICLRRSPKETLKVYIFDGVADTMPEIVNPHDHRYDFDTAVVCGSSTNITYDVVEGSDEGEVFNRFKYATPLNGGNGFTFDKEQRLRIASRSDYPCGTGYAMKHDRIHTIRIGKDTVLVLKQYADVVDGPTFTWTRGNEPPNLSGLYNRFTRDQLVARLKQINHLFR